MPRPSSAWAGFLTFIHHRDDLRGELCKLARGGPFIIERQADGRFLGRAGILVWDTRTWTLATSSEAGPYAQPELGWALARAAWGNGYATEAARAVRDWTRDWRGVDCLIFIDRPAQPRLTARSSTTWSFAGRTVMLFDRAEAVVWVHPTA